MHRHPVLHQCIGTGLDPQLVEQRQLIDMLYAIDVAQSPMDRIVRYEIEEKLVATGAGTLVLHESAFDSRASRKLQRTLDSALGPPILRRTDIGETLIFYDIPDPS